MIKKRIDVLLVDLGHSRSRERAKAQIIAGYVYVNGKQVKVPSEQYSAGDTIEVRQDSCPFVSRGGLKLEQALQSFDINLKGRVCADIGASTGGFTDCMLQNGASFVYAVDVGYGQFDWTLRNDKRVKLFERTNARYLEPFDQEISFVAVDVSFISLRLIFPSVLKIGGDDLEVITLIKPQFEAGKDKVGKHGVVREPTVHLNVIEDIKLQASKLSLNMIDLTFSPITGPKGNIEYLAHYVTKNAKTISLSKIQTVVSRAHECLQ